MVCHLLWAKGDVWAGCMGGCYHLLFPLIIELIVGYAMGKSLWAMVNGRRRDLSYGRDCSKQLLCWLYRVCSPDCYQLSLFLLHVVATVAVYCSVLGESAESTVEEV